MECDNCLQKINIVIVSDHGMVETPKERTITLSDYIDPSLYDVWGGFTVLNVRPKQGMDLSHRG